MKLYLALNEGGTHGDMGLHARMAVLSAMHHTDLQPVLLYIGNRNEHTSWFERNGVDVIDSELPYIALIERLTKEGKYWTESLGHWLRTNVCLEEKSDEYVLYTDVDVVFLSRTRAGSLKPAVFCAAPEFSKDSWNYFNAGVMVANVRKLRESYDDFEKYLVENIEQHTYNFHDQIAYNVYYRNKWDRLPVEMNWKPYWGFNKKAEIVHFHGPKISAITSILDNTWNWDNNYGSQLGSLFVSSFPAYVGFIKAAVDSAVGLDAADVDRLLSVAERIGKFDPSPYRSRINTDFMNYKMFPE
jgi:hypothetical protein